MKTTQIRMRILLTLSLTVLGSLAPQARGEWLRVPFTAYVATKVDEGLELEGVAVGDVITGSYTFDVAPLPVSYPGPYSAYYVFSSPQQRLRNQAFLHGAAGQATISSSGTTSAEKRARIWMVMRGMIRVSRFPARPVSSMGDLSTRPGIAASRTRFPTPARTREWGASQD